MIQTEELEIECGAPGIAVGTGEPVEARLEPGELRSRSKKDEREDSSEVRVSRRSEHFTPCFEELERAGFDRAA